MAHEQLKPWKKGQSGNPKGRPAGSRTVAINIIFKVFNKYGAKGFEKQMRELAQNNPAAFYLKFIQPIQPKDISFISDGEDSLEVKITKTYGCNPDRKTD